METSGARAVDSDTWEELSHVRKKDFHRLLKARLVVHYPLLSISPGTFARGRQGERRVNGLMQCSIGSTTKMKSHNERSEPWL